MFRLVETHRSVVPNTIVERIDSAVDRAQKNPQINANVATHANLYIQHSPFKCCGLTGIMGLNSLYLGTWEEKANFAQFLKTTFHTPGHLIYVLERHQLGLPSHQFMMDIGAQRMGEEFRNLNYDNHWLSIWIVNVKDPKNFKKYLDQYDRPLPDPNKNIAKVATVAKMEKV